MEKQTYRIVMLASLLLAFGCAKQATLLHTENNSAEVDSYFLSMDDWSKFSPLKNDNLVEDKSKTAVKTEKITQDDGSIGETSCETKQYDLTRTPEKIVTQNPAGGVLYPGALLQGRGYLQGPGGLRELSIRKRAPMALVSDLSSDQSAVVMHTVDYSEFEKARSTLLNSISKTVGVTPANFYYNQIEASQTNQAALDLGFSVKYIGNSLKGDIKAKTSSKEKVFMVVFEHRAFTLSVVAPSTPSGYFTSDFSVDDLKTQERMGTIGANNPALYVSSVSYGRMLMFTITTKASAADIQAAFKGSYSNGLTTVKGSLDAKYQQIMNESRINVISLGGATSASEQLIKTGRINEYFEQNSSLHSFVPISYVIRNVKDNSIAKVSETTRYSTQECTAAAPKAWKVKITIEKMIAHNAGAESRGEVYGRLMFGGKMIMDRSQSNYISIKNGDSYYFPPDRNSVEVILPVAKPQPIPLAAYFMDNDKGFIFNPDDNLATFSEQIGYTLDGRILSSGTYSVRNRNIGDIELIYNVERLEPVYR